MTKSFMGNMRPLMQQIHRKMPAPNQRAPLSLREIYALVQSDIDPRELDPIGAVATALTLMIEENNILITHQGDLPTFQLIKLYQQ